MILTIFISFLVLMAIGYGFYNVKGYDISLEIKLYNNPYYKLGIFFESFVHEDVLVEDFCIGLFFINFSLTFYKFDT